MRLSHLQYHQEAEHDHWWFAARRAIVLAQIERHVGPPTGDRAVLDIGCGAGIMLRHLARWGPVAGMDTTRDAVEMARAAGTDDVRQGALPEDVPFDDGSFALVTMLDVLEHIEDDVAALHAVNRLLVPGGTLVLTVPAFEALWSGHDVVNEHQRRYHRRGLRAALQAANFRVARISYFNTLLFPPIAGVRLLGRLRPGDSVPRADEGRMPGPVNAVLKRIFLMEKPLLAALDLPFGVSLLAVAQSENGGAANA